MIRDATALGFVPGENSRFIEPLCRSYLGPAVFFSRSSSLQQPFKRKIQLRNLSI
jgi:hypothetical protein